jgi:Ty3 transposon capsid-like protein
MSHAQLAATDKILMILLNKTLEQPIVNVDGAQRRNEERNVARNADEDSEEANVKVSEADREANKDQTSEEEPKGKKNMEQSANVINEVNEKKIIRRDEKISRVNIKEFCRKPEPFSFGYSELKEFDNSVYKMILNQNFNKKEKIYIVNNYLMGQASSWSREYLEAQKHTTYTQFYDALKKPFSDPEQKTNNLQKLYGLKMNNSLEKYIREFVSLSANTITDGENKCFLLEKD